MDRAVRAGPRGLTSDKPGKNNEQPQCTRRPDVRACNAASGMRTRCDTRQNRPICTVVNLPELD